GTVTETDNRFATLLLAGGGSARVACGGIKLTAGQTLSFSVRSENLNAHPAPSDGFSLPATVAENNYIGGMLRIIFRLSDGREIYSTRHGIHRRVSLGDTVYLSWEPENAALVDVEG
ncbi:MAG: TOBE domain-containing protein, partial [Angelakisella sp.]